MIASRTYSASRKRPNFNASEKLVHGNLKRTPQLRGCAGQKQARLLAAQHGPSLMLKFAGRPNA
jgi:hypothetical protein